MEWFLNDLSALFQALLIELQHAVSPAWWHENWVALLNILMIDLVLAGDNAIVVGMAASRVEASIRSRVIFWGIAAAVILRIVFAAMTTQLLAVVGLKLAGGILLLWVCWKMYSQIQSMHQSDGTQAGGVDAASATQIGFGAAL